MLKIETNCRQPHQNDLDKLDAPDQHRLVILVGQLPGGCREQKKRQDKNPCRYGDNQSGIIARIGGKAISHQNNQPLLEAIIVKCSQCLSDKERQKTLQSKQIKLGMGHDVRMIF